MSKSLVLLVTLLLPVLGVGIAGSRGAADREQILEHIHGIFRAFIAGDREAIERMHTSDWVGFLGPSTGIERGIDAYMANADLSLDRFQGTGYELHDTEVQLYGDLALVYYVADYRCRDKQTGADKTIPLRSIDVYRREAGGWNQAGSHITPIRRRQSWTADEGAAPVVRTLSSAEHRALMQAREGVWRAWFDNDRDTLKALLPDELIAINAGERVWSDLESTLAASREFVTSRTALVRLEFPRTELQVYGNVAILYSTYLFETDADGNRRTTEGRATEIFVQRDSSWINTGWHLDSGE